VLLKYKEEELHQKSLFFNLKGKDQLQDLGIDGRMILRWVSRIGCESMVWIYVAQDPVAASCERDIEPSHSIF
jgi:hypothetical protein